jgi:uncharacterized protein (TIGR02646 family)
MVHTPRHDKAPRLLQQKKTAWTKRWQEILAGKKRADWATNAAKKALQQGLHRLAHGKCAFCEGVLGAQTDLEVEHYTAKSLEPEIAFEWTNLLPACHKCNTAKSSQPHENRLLKTDIEDPEVYFWVDPDTGRLEPYPTLDEQGRQRAEETVRLLDLQRPALRTQRQKMACRVGRWLRHVSEEGLTQLTREEWEDLSDPTTEFKLAVRHTLRLHGYRALAEEDKRKFEAPK